MLKVTVYSTESCQWCAKAKEFFKENKIAFTNKNVGKDAKAAKEMIAKSGQKGVPVIDINGKIIVGFDDGELRKALKLG